MFYIGRVCPDDLKKYSSLYNFFHLNNAGRPNNTCKYMGGGGTMCGETLKPTGLTDFLSNGHSDYEA